MRENLRFIDKHSSASDRAQKNKKIEKAPGKPLTIDERLVVDRKIAVTVTIEFVVARSIDTALKRNARSKRFQILCSREHLIDLIANLIQQASRSDAKITECIINFDNNDVSALAITIRVAMQAPSSVRLAGHGLYKDISKMNWSALQENSSIVDIEV